jgi:hypothetical protein
MKQKFHTFSELANLDKFDTAYDLLQFLTTLNKIAVPSSIDISELLLWCENNTKSFSTYLPASLYRNEFNVFYFIEKDDAMRFKLIWGGNGYPYT